MAVSENPQDHKEIATFEGSGAAAEIRYSVPLPGAYSFDRIVPVELPADAFADQAKSSGASLSDLGIATVDAGKIRSLSADRLAAFLKTSLPADARPALQLVTAETGLTVSAVPPGPEVTEAAALDVGIDADRTPLRLAAQVQRFEREVKNPFIDKLAALQEQEARTGTLTAIRLPIAGLGNSIRLATLTVAEPQPRIAIVETYEVSSSLGDYGLGRTLQTFSLLPGERTTISVETWRTSEATREDASSIFDSSDTAAQTRFTSALSRESGSAFQEQGGWAFSIGVKAGGGFNLGLVSASASVETGFSANHQEARQSFAKSVSQSASEHASQVNTARRQAVQSSSSSTDSSGASEATVREIANTNLRRVLNFVFRELNQTYRVRTALRGVKVAFYNGNSDSAEVVTLAEMPRLLRSYVAEGRREAVARAVLALVAQCVDHTGTPQTMLQAGTREGGVFAWADAELDDEGDLDFADDPLSAKVAWRIKPGPIGQGGVGEKDRVNGVLTDQNEIVLRTDNVVVEALLGRADALDPYASALQSLDLRSREADIAWRVADTSRTLAALQLVEAQAAGERVDAWEKILGDRPDIQVVPAAVAANGDGPNP